MSKILATVLFLFLATFTKAQLPVLNWAKSFNAYYTTNSNGRTVGIDAQGNVYSAGLFMDSVDFDPGPGVYKMVAANSARTSIFITKLDANGNFVWAGQIPTYVEFGHINLKVDGAGNIYMTSDLRIPADMDPGPGVFMMSPTGFRDAFVVKIDSNGNLVWAKQFGGPGDTGPQGYAIEIDRDNNLVIGGIFNNTVDFDPGPVVLNITSSAHMQAFVVKLNNNGSLMWAKQFGNGPEVYSGCRITDLECDLQNNIVITGSFNRTCDFDPGPGIHNVTVSNGSVGDGFICKLDANCNFIWVKTIGQHGTNNHNMTPTGIDTDAMNNIVITGFYIGDFDFDPGPGTNIIYANPWDCFILKLDALGNYVWAKVIGNANEYDEGHDVVVDDVNNVYVTGIFGTSVDFDPGPGTHIINSSHYGPGAIIKLSPNGDFIYAAPFQSLNSGTAYFWRIVVDATNIYGVGYVSGINDFDPGPGVYSLAGSSGYAPFVLKLSRCLNITRSTLNISTCNNYTLNNQVYDSTGTYQQTIQNSTGCDSIITLNLTINKKQTARTTTICEGESIYAGGANQFTNGTYFDTLQTVMGCDSVVKTTLIVNPKPLPNLGADKSICQNTQVTLSPGSFTSYLWQDNSISSSFTVNSVGSYWVRVTDSFNCSATDTFRLISIRDNPSNFLKGTDSLCNYESLQILPTSSYSSYLWSTGSTQKGLTIQQPGSFQLTVTDAYGCKGSDTITVFPKQCMLGVFIPTAFTPNNDGKNDLFRPKVFGKLKNYQMSIYHRGGMIVFQSTDPAKGWDGKINGLTQDSQVFVWVCSYQVEGMEAKVEKGRVLVIR